MKNWSWIEVWVTWKSSYWEIHVYIVGDVEVEGTALSAFLCRDSSKATSSHWLYIFM